MSRPQIRRSGRGMTTAEYAVCLTCALGVVSLLASEGFRSFLFDLLSTVWQLALQPRHFVLLVDRWMS